VQGSQGGEAGGVWSGSCCSRAGSGVAAALAAAGPAPWIAAGGRSPTCVWMAGVADSTGESFQPEMFASLWEQKEVISEVLYAALESSL